MKNVHLLPTNPNDETKKGIWIKETRDWSNIYITSSDEEIKLSNWACHKGITNDKYQLVKCTISNKESIQEHWSKIILTTDLELIKDGVQAIDDIFLEWFVNNPDCEWVDVDTRPKVSSPYEKGFVIDNPNYNKIIISKEAQKQHLIDIMKGDEELGLYDEEPKQETLEEASWKVIGTKDDTFYNGAKWQEKRSYSEEEVKKMLFDLGDALFNNCQNGIKEGEPEKYFDVIIEQYKK